MVVGCTGRGKTTFCNFLLKHAKKEDQSVIESSSFNRWEETASVHSCAQMHTFEDDIEKKKLKIIDTPGYLATWNQRGQDNDKFKQDREMMIKEISKALTFAFKGVDAILVTLVAAQRMTKEESLMADFLTEMKLWDHCILLFTHGRRVGDTEEMQYKDFYEYIQSDKLAKDCPVLKTYYELAKRRFLIVESVDQANDPIYHRSKLDELYGAIAVTKEANKNIPFTHPLFETAKEAFELRLSKYQIEKEQQKVMDLLHALNQTNQPEVTGNGNAGVNEHNEESEFSETAKILYKYLKGNEEDPGKVVETLRNEKRRITEAKQKVQDLRNELVQGKKTERDVAKKLDVVISGLSQSVETPQQPAAGEQIEEKPPAAGRRLCTLL